MDLELTETQVALKAAVKQMVDRHMPRRRLVDLQDREPGWDRDWLTLMASSGWLGLNVPEEIGGSDASVFETAIVFEELGAGPVPGPFFESSMLATTLLKIAPPSTRRDEYLNGIADGATVMIPAVDTGQATWAKVTQNVPTARKIDGKQWTVDFQAPFVSHALSATKFLCLVRLDDPTGPLALAVIDPTLGSVTSRLLRGFLSWHGEVTFDNVAINDSDLFVIEDESGAERDFEAALVVLAAFQVGACDSLLRISTDYSNTRKQFGTLIGKFQRVQDHVVRILNAVDGARWKCYEAAAALDSGHDSSVRAHMAKAVASEALWESANAAHDVHAGIGSDPQYGLTLYTRFSRSSYAYLGSPRSHRMQMLEGIVRESSKLGVVSESHV